MFQTSSDYFVVGACVVFALFLLIRIMVHRLSVRKHRKKGLEPILEKRGTAGAFKEKMIDRLAAQQTDAVLGEIVGLLQKQRENLSGVTYRDTPECDFGKTFDGRPMMTTYEKIFHLKEKGMTNDAICRKLMLSLSEISLFLKVRAAR